MGKWYASCFPLVMLVMLVSLRALPCTNLVAVLTLTEIAEAVAAGGGFAATAWLCGFIYLTAKRTLAVTVGD